MWEETICGNSSLPVWDYLLTWNTTNPNFTSCFHRTVLVWIPCCMLWIFLPIEVYCILHSRAKLIRWNLLNITKLISVAILLIISIIKLCILVSSTNSKELLFVDVFTIAGLASSFLLIFVLIYFERKHGMQSSGLLFFFWLTASFTGTFTFRSLLINRDHVKTYSEKMEESLFLIYYPLVISQLLLSVFKDAEPLYRCKEDAEENCCPKNSSSFISRMTFYWLDNLLWKCYRSDVQVSDIWKSSYEVMTKYTVPKLLKQMAAYKLKNRTKLHWAIWKMHWSLFVQGWILRFAGDTLIYANPVLLQYFLEVVSNDEPIWHGYVIIVGMFLAAAAEALTCWHASFYANTIVISTQSSVISLIYRKSLTISNSCKRTTTTGEIINHMAIDVKNVSLFVYDLVFNGSFILQITIGIYLLWNLLGIASLAGLGLMILLTILSAVIAHKWEKIELEQLKLKDQRIKHLNEAVIGIKVLKFFAWERPFMQQIGDIRMKELKTIKRGLIYRGISTIMWTVSSFLVATVMIATYVLIDSNNVLDASKAFVTVTLVDILSIPMLHVPTMLAEFIQAYVSMGRLNKFLSKRDINPSDVVRDATDENAINVEDASFAWDLDGDPILTDINLEVPKGQLLAVVGQVGCGKSSLLASVLGEMEKLCGKVYLKGSVAFAPQQAWIQNATLKNNILFGKPLNQQVYEAVLKACALEPDLTMLPGGDETEIGEKGINLSGGQKQRVSLARAVYCDADVYLLDDPLSAVDTHVGQQLFHQVIGPTGLLKNKTRILVTHATTYLPSVDNIIVLKNGKITETGTYQNLLANNGAFAEFLTNYGQDNSRDNCNSVHLARSESCQSKHNDADDEYDNGGSKLITVEALEHGQVKRSVYFLYLKYAGVYAGIAFLALLFVSEAFNASAHVWLSLWSAQSSTESHTSSEVLNMRLSIYASLGILYGLFMFFGILTSIFAAIRASVQLHSKLLYSIVRCPMSFFDTTPSGRIINRFSRDVEMIDGLLPGNFQEFFVCITEILGALIVIAIQVPLLLVVIVPIGTVYYLIQKFMIRSADQLRRLESITKSPIYARFSETIAGTTTVRAFQRQHQFIQEFEEMIDINLKNSYYVKVLFRWIGVRLDLLGNILVVFTALFGLLQRDSLSVSTIGLIVSYASSINFIFAWMVHTAGMLESNIVSVERLHEYICLEPEAEWENATAKVDPNWPVQGEIEFKKFSTKYRKELPPVLNELTFRINDGEKIGIVGRTGAGKSSVTLSLFRILEATEGCIVIDGVDISDLGLHQLRSRLTIIPQDPVLYSGPLRMNLDPFNHHTDEELWKALELAHLRDHVMSLNKGLAHQIAEGGENLSVGQRQLACLARALLRKSKVLILDEATAAVDLMTDDLIRSTINQEFADSTVITIAHRLNTIMDSTRVVVMDNGVVKEFATPSDLLSNTESIFYGMAKVAGLVE